MKILKKIALMAATLVFGTAVGATIGHADSVKSELKAMKDSLIFNSKEGGV